MTATTTGMREHGNAYEIFILVLTLGSLLVMVLLLLPLPPAVLDILTFYDNLICVIFLADFAYNLSGSHPKSEYFIRRRGWLDLLGSIPSLGILRLTGLLRLARLSRLARILRFFRGTNQRQLIADIVRNRGQYALFITLLLVMLVLSTASVLVLVFESADPNANITNGGDALWWSFVTITTVGYGDRYPVTGFGRTTGVFVMFMGIGVIGALASILASLLVAPAPADAEAGDGATEAGEAPVEPAATSPELAATLARMEASLFATRTELEQARAELAALHRTVEGASSAAAPPS
jgi:voltage-gated potassium channel